MNLELNQGLEKSSQRMNTSKETEKFICELTDYLDSFKEEIINRLPKNNENQIDGLRKENCLYQVVGLTSKGAYLQNTENDMIFEEINITEELKKTISNDYVLRYENGKYKFEEEITEDFYQKMVGVKEHQIIQEKFEKESNILKLDSNTKYRILSRGDNFTTLIYDKGKLKVPNELIPYFANNNTILSYSRSGRFLRIK